MSHVTNWTCRHCHKPIHGQRSEHCPVCHETFTGTTAGDMHRRGDHGITTGPNRRRCLTTDEMLDRGMTQDSHGRWTTGRAYTGPSESDPR